MNFNIVILAAGQGKRMHSDLPKVLHPLAGQPMLAHVLHAARALQPQKIVVVYGHGGEQVRAYFASADGILWAEQREQRGTGHALMQALPLLDATAPTLVLCGDVPLIQIDTLQQLCTLAGDGVGLLTDTVEDATGLGRIVRAASGQVLRIVEHKDANETERALREINTGIMVLPTTRLTAWLTALRCENAQQEYYLTDVIDLAVTAGVPVHALLAPVSWQVAGVNSQSQLACVERHYQRGCSEALMEQGVMLADPARIDIRGTLRCGRDVRIDVNTVFEGEVELGDGVVIGANCVLRDCRVGAHSQIAAFSLLEDSILGAQCHIGPYARLRGGNVFADQVDIGNFVEVKGSRIEQASKAKHLSYIGDSDIGSQVNIGAGCVTCNYDGAYKYRTTIEDRVFVGSGSMLVAPVTLEAGATIGAGSVITKCAPADTLTLARAKQVSLSGWQRPRKNKK